MNRRQREFEWRPGRFKDAVLYIAEQLADDPTFGSTKLNKILYFSDTAAYRKLGRPITGALYQRNRYGPTAVEYQPMVGELESDRYVDVRHTRVVDHDQEVVTPTGRIRPNMRQFSDAERAILDATITEFRGYTNTKSSDRSHERSAGWLAFNQGETIPYRTSIISPEPVSDDVVAYMERAEELIG
jgi:Protein of unknown function (DUF4065)